MFHTKVWSLFLFWVALNRKVEGFFYLCIMSRYLALFFCFISFVQLSAQGVINAEQYLNSKDSLIVAANFTYHGTRGNATSDKVKISPTFLLKQKYHQYKLFGNYSRLSGGGNRFLNSGFIHFRHNYLFHKRVKTFAFAQTQFNEVLLLEERNVFGAGLRFSLFQRDSLKSSLGLGIMNEYERLNETSLISGEVFETNFIRTAFVHSFSYTLKNISFSNVLYYQANVLDVLDIRLLSESMIRMKLNAKFDFLVEHTIRYDSRPPSNLVNSDTDFN